VCASGVRNTGMETTSISAVNTALPPSRSASMPMGSRANDPRSTGTATRSAAWVAERWSVSRNRGAKAAINPQAAKQTANEIVERVRGSDALCWRDVIVQADDFEYVR
jgi:hypothetical protein